jgi:hypothetical protein
LEWLDSRRPGWRIEFAAALGLGLFLGLIGPFGSYGTAPWWQRGAWWTAALLFGTSLFGTLARSAIARRMSFPRTLIVLSVSAAVAAAPFAIVIGWVARRLWPRLGALGPLDWYAQVIAIALPLLFVAALAARLRRPPAAAPAPQPVPAPLGVDPREVVCLSMEDHYVRVHHDGGSHLVLATLQQAIAALGPVSGLQVHRSWWVADRVVCGAVAEGRNVRLRLSGGITAPVARSFVAAVRSRGWLAIDDSPRR